MNYAPHTLQKRVIAGEVNDEYGRPITGESAEEWSEVCKCRCDDNGDKEVKLSDGTVVVPSYHIALDGNTPDIMTGDYIRCLREDGSIRGEGHIIKTKTLNYLPYAEIYV